MKPKLHDLLTFFVILIFLGTAFAIISAPEGTGKASKNTRLEDNFKEYFLLSAMINYQTNNAITQIKTDSMKHSTLQKTPQEYFKCSTLLKNIERAKELRKQIMQEFDYLPEMNCFHEVSETDLKKFRILENQCRNNALDPGLPEKIVKIYNYQKKTLNSGCMKQTELFTMLQTTYIKVKAAG